MRLDMTASTPLRSGKLAILLVCLLLEGCVQYTYPWKDSEAMRRDLLRVTPLRSSLGEVEQKLRARHVRLQKSLNTGFLRQPDSGPSEVVGEKSIWAHLGGYRSGFFTTTTIDAYWGFDGQEKLIEIWVWKVDDSL
jgi:hypothetical protein